MKKALLWMLACVALSQQAQASHGVAFDLQYEPVGTDSLRVTLKFYRDCAGIQAPTMPVINIVGCAGSPTSLTLSQVGTVQIVPVVSAPYVPNITCNGGSLPGIEYYEYSAVMPIDTTCNSYEFSYEECCRNAAITNLVQSESFHIKAWLDATQLNANNEVNSSVNLTTAPVPYMCNNQMFTYNHGAFDADGDSLVFTPQVPLGGAGAPIAYVSSYNLTTPFSMDSTGYVQDPVTGQITFTPVGVQVVVVSMLVDEYRNGLHIGSTMRDMQMYVYQCDSNQNVVLRPIANVQGAMFTPNANQLGGVFKVAPGAGFSFSTSAEDPDQAQSITATSNIAQMIPGSSFSATNGNPASISLSVAPLTAKRAYFTITFADNANPIPNRQTLGFMVEQDLASGVQTAVSSVWNTRISPNPVSAQSLLQVSLEGLQAGETTFTLFDLSGKMAMQRTIGTQQGRHEALLQLPNLADGMYLLQIRNGQGVQTHKLIVR